MIRKKCNIIVFSTQYYYITALPNESVYTEFYLGFSGLKINLQRQI